MLANSATDPEINMQNAPDRKIEIMTHGVLVISKRPESIIKELVPKAIPAPNDI
jgi:hypothetical protein